MSRGDFPSPRDLIIALFRRGVNYYQIQSVTGSRTSAT